MEEDYYQITSELDAREVLRYLNHLGIHNISGEILKYFISDLKKLIKYDLQQKYNKKEEELERPGPERLHGASTFCSRIRSKTQNNEKIVCSRECERFKKPFKLRNIHSAPAMGTVHLRDVDEKPVRRACSCNAVEKRSEALSKETRRTTSTGLSNNIIIVPRPPVKKKSDPVSLYHYYTALWAKYKPNVPGENDWAELRWHIRQKMAGLSSPPSENRIPEHQLKGRDIVHSKK